MLLARNELYTVTFSELYLEEFIRRICEDEDVIAYIDEYCSDISLFNIDIPFIGKYSAGGTVYEITHQNGKISKGWRDAIDEYCEYIADIIVGEIEIEGESSYKGYTIIQTED